MADLGSPAWLLPADVSDQLSVALLPAGALPPAAERARLAAAAWVQHRRRDLVTLAVYDAAGLIVVTPAAFTPTADVYLGALMLAHRLYARRGSPQGLASFGEMGVGAVLRLDPDIERLLGIGRHGKPVAR